MGVSARFEIEDEQALKETEAVEAGGEKVEYEIVGVSACLGVECGLEKVETETQAADRKKVVVTSDPATTLEGRARVARLAGAATTAC